MTQNLELNEEQWLAVYDALGQYVENEREAVNVSGIQSHNLYAAEQVLNQMDGRLAAEAYVAGAT